MKNRVWAAGLSALLISAVLWGCSPKDQGKTPDKSAAEKETAGQEAAIAEEKGEESQQRIGIALPDRSQKKWRKAGRMMKQTLRERGYEVDLVFGENQSALQAEQIENMVDSGCKLLIIAPVEGAVLTEPLAHAENQEIPVIAYEDLIRDTAGVDYYVTYDHLEGGKLQGKAIESAVKAHPKEEPFYLEIFSGDLQDIDAYFFYEGAMEVLEPLIETGRVVIKSGQVTQAQTAVEDWSMQGAQNRMSLILSTYYPMGETVDGVLCAEDSLALGVENALATLGMADYPMITGAGCEPANVSNLATGKQGMDLFHDPLALAREAAKMALDIMKHGETDVNAKASYDNGARVVETNLIPPKACTPENYQELLAEWGSMKQTDPE